MSPAIMVDAHFSGLSDVIETTCQFEYISGVLYDEVAYAAYALTIVSDRGSLYPTNTLKPRSREPSRLVFAFLTRFSQFTRETLHGH